MEQEVEMDELTSMKQELENLGRERDSLGMELAARDGEISGLRKSLEDREAGITSLKEAAAVADGMIESLTGSLERTAAKYKELAISSLPGVTPDMISGKTAEEIENSVENVRTIVERVRQEVEAETSRARVPAGAPQRGVVELSGLSAREKIQFAVGVNK